jgi:hydrogenase maturation protein HypF
MIDDSIPGGDAAGNRCERILVRGVVQGVGFRPFVYNTALDLGLAGTVANTREGVEIILEGRGEALSRFKTLLFRTPPKLSKITDIRVEARPLAGLTGFSIGMSREGRNPGALVPPDAALCDACRSELEDPEDRRYAYPFINCTDCGPRFTVVRNLPYDRMTTTMDEFPMCPECLEEYGDPRNRRFHAQADCCPVCGPTVFLEDRSGDAVSGPKAVERAVALLEKGFIVAVKGIGGFHLAVDATNDDAVSRLRRLKDRGGKPFAVMAPTLDRIQEFAEVNGGEAEHLASPARPVVILVKRKRPEDAPSIAEAVAPENPLIGVMLPYAPLHVLLFKGKVSVLVMTSANRKNDPIVRDNRDALSALGGMADAFLFHDREIHIRSDDSVGRWMGGAFRVFRRSRGYAPMPVPILTTESSILATGGFMKNTLCMVKDGAAFLSPHIGDLETPAGFEFFHETAGHMDRLFDIGPSVIVQDSHPDAVTAGYGRHFPAAGVLAVQHHHAHIVSCMVENGYTGEVIGFAFDGTGYGDDGTVWGGEVLMVSMDRYRRVAHVDPVPMPGGAAAVKEPWRMGISRLYRVFGDGLWNLDVPLLNGGWPLFDVSAAGTLVTMMERKINSPLTSSMGRLFDAVSAVMGLCPVSSYDGQAAMALEFCAMDAPDGVSGYPVDMIREKDGVLVADACPLIRAVVRDLEFREPRELISARFHQTLIDGFAGIGARLAERTGVRVAALSGGVFQNARLFTGLSRALSDKNITVLTHAHVPANDGGLSLGQAGIAAALCRNKESL